MKPRPLHEPYPKRREFLRGVVATAGLALASCATARAREEGPEEEAEVTPGEDLMQEHGVLERILLVYDEGARRIDGHETFDLAVIASAAGIVRRFVEDYHEKLEEQFVFPRLQRAHREVQLVAILLQQHQRGRQLTDDIIRMAGESATQDLARTLRSFVRMYRPHAAREDTVLFPAFRGVVGRVGYAELGEQFEDKEHELFGAHGFEDTVAQVARLEAVLGIDDLARFTA